MRTISDDAQRDKAEAEDSADNESENILSEDGNQQNKASQNLKAANRVIIQETQQIPAGQGRSGREIRKTAGQAP